MSPITAEEAQSRRVELERLDKNLAPVATPYLKLQILTSEYAQMSKEIAGVPTVAELARQLRSRNALPETDRVVDQLKLRAKFPVVELGLRIQETVFGGSRSGLMGEIETRKAGWNSTQFLESERDEVARRLGELRETEQAVLEGFEEALSTFEHQAKDMIDRLDMVPITHKKRMTNAIGVEGENAILRGILQFSTDDLQIEGLMVLASLLQLLQMRGLEGVVVAAC
ncbi:hypothetical protein K490DRAFT_58187 [Saccharata proteae CBS 121410]|uniref:Uncharacterized protein n=1 Tax=Saccharata proteae CBS 121410 TaxID=1314787 RepID=A0A9P4HVW3_9PEZI|nr:hypothetical protein K490DRAFT_58187 [Saccharata proteae CBS 121410]